jgi:hypothetical protein
MLPRKVLRGLGSCVSGELTIRTTTEVPLTSAILSPNPRMPLLARLLSY